MFQARGIAFPREMGTRGVNSPEHGMREESSRDEGQEPGLDAKIIRTLLHQ